MAQNLANKKQTYLQAVVNNALALKAARDDMKMLAEKNSQDATYSGISQADIDAAAAGGASVGHLTPTILANFLTVLQPAVESAITTGAGHFAALLDTLPN